MKRPSIKPLDDIEAIIKNVEETESASHTLRERPDVVVRGLGPVISDKDEIVELATHIYWIIPEVK